MVYRLILLGACPTGMVWTEPVQLTICLSGGTFDRRVTTPGSDTVACFTSGSTVCNGAGCSNLPELSNPNSLRFDFIVTSDSSNGAGAVLSGSLAQSPNLSPFNRENALDQNARFTENV